MRENVCPWSVWGSRYEKDTTSFLLKTLNDNHTCHRVQKNRLASACWLSKRYTKALKPGGNFNFRDFMGKVIKDYILTLSRSQVYRAKNKAGEIIIGSLYAQYGKLRDYAEELKRFNPGLVEAINELLKGSEHRFCVRHMYANFKKKFKDDLIRNKVWQAAKASAEEEWKDIMEKIKIIVNLKILFPSAADTLLRQRVSAAKSLLRANLSAPSNFLRQGEGARPDDLCQIFLVPTGSSPASSVSGLGHFPAAMVLPSPFGLGIIRFCLL
ncbi:hypothetical protein LWI28_006266 [Acer negundo]|uniref:MULE transposase domain-containing protein n=1 Tax=Acer negundo TaxID=4023 RepID=A0AAD5JCL0_ACENE|nr:hypothetical protein LWI28_006266 [Acer negundo]